VFGKICPGGTFQTVINCSCASAIEIFQTAKCAHCSTNPRSDDYWGRSDDDWSTDYWGRFHDNWGRDKWDRLHDYYRGRPDDCWSTPSDPSCNSPSCPPMCPACWTFH